MGIRSFKLKESTIERWHAELEVLREERRAVNESTTVLINNYASLSEQLTAKEKECCELEKHLQDCVKLIELLKKRINETVVTNQKIGWNAPNIKDDTSELDKNIKD